MQIPVTLLKVVGKFSSAVLTQNAASGLFVLIVISQLHST